MRLANKVAIITGAGAGIGRATALLFAREGARVVASFYESGDDVELERSAGELSSRIAAVRADVRREEDAAALARTAVERFGGLDILVNNAGIEMPGLATETTAEMWADIIDVNLKGVFFCSKHAVAEMLKAGRGAIVNISSINGIRGNHRLVAYSASKGGVVAITRAMALDHAPENIRVNCVCPATIENTRMMDASMKRQANPDEHRRYLLAKHPMGRLGRPEEVANAVLFLASDEASFITGITLPIDGGRSIR
jgi:NAD(P)-dependent dehydrogenase (short-subunit alcohol dehydrogenase family)